MEDNKKKRIISIGIIIFIIILLVSGGTLAYWSWQTADEQKTEVTLTISQYFSCAADGGGNITAQDAFIAPTSCTNSQHAIKREIKAMPTVLGNNPTVNMQLYLDVNLLDTGLSNSQNFRYALTTSSTSCTEGVVEEGTFNGKVAGNKVLILDKNYDQTLTDTYYLYIWLDGAETSQSTMNQNFSLSLSGKCEEIAGGAQNTTPNEPVLDSGMIPVKIANNGTVTTVAESDSSWYNYSNKEWANVVLVDSDSRASYKNMTGVTVNQDDILAYYVWIPRYAYKIPESISCFDIVNLSPENYPQCFELPYTMSDSDKQMLIQIVQAYAVDNLGMSEFSLEMSEALTNEALQTGKYVMEVDGVEQSMTLLEVIDMANSIAGTNIVATLSFNENNLITGHVPKPINISFENKNAPVLTGDAVNTYRTHPAFVFGDEKISGIWVGKFDMTGNETMPTILPNNSIIYYGNNSEKFIMSLKFAGGILSNGIVSFAGSNTYGLTANTDSHMMKNSEWGAVAYLSHSVYGINEEIRINNYLNIIYKTGCGASEPNAAESTECQIAYGGASSYPQSTTGNITGVFDMSGGALKSMMSVLVDDNGNPRSGKELNNYNSGFNGLLSDDSLYSEGIDFPQVKYYDKYISGDLLTACNGGICYGHALSETSGWYSDLIIDSISSDEPWYWRFGFIPVEESHSYGVFGFAAFDGSGWDLSALRSVLVAR